MTNAVEDTRTAARDPASSRQGSTGTDLAVAGTVSTIAAIVYARTALRGPGVGDTAKLEFVGKVLGTPHATGYPLYILVSHLAGLVPIGSLATRINLLSALCAAVAVGIVYAILRALEVSRLCAVAASLIFAFTSTLWSQAVIAEVYALQEALMALAILCCIRWWKGGGSGWAVAAVAVEATMLGNHLMTVTLVPATMLMLWCGRRRIAGRTAVAMGACALIPIALYSTLYVWTVIRPSHYLESPVASLHDLRYVVSGEQFNNVMFAYSAREVLRTRIPMVWDEVWGQFGWLVVVVAVGFAVLARRDRVVAAFFALIALVDLVVVLNYGIDDIYIYFLPAWTAAAIVLGIGFDAALKRIGPRGLASACAVVVLLLPLWPLIDNWSAEDMSDGFPIGSEIKDSLGRVPDNSLILASAADYNNAEVIWYYLFGDGVGDERNISLYSPYDVAAVCRYLRDGTPPDTTWHRYVNRLGKPTPLPERPPPGLPVFTLGIDDTFIAAGFTLDPNAAPGVYRVLPPPTCAP